MRTRKSRTREPVSGSYLERLQNKFKNNPAIAWLSITAAFVVTVSGIIVAVKSLVTEITPASEEPKLNIVLTTVDPRFGEPDETGRRMNWGGGSQSLFLQTVTTPLELLVERPLGFSKWPEFDLDAFVQSRAIAGVWEVLPTDEAADGMTIRVNATYDAPRDAPPCVVLSWGLTADTVPVPTNGIYVGYRGGGGSYVPPSGGQVRITTRTGDYDISTWLPEEEDESGASKALTEDTSSANTTAIKHRPQPKVQYLNPGEPAFLDVNVIGPPLENGSSTVMPFMARRLHVYVRVLVRGKQYVIKSRNAVRAVAIDGEDDGWPVDDDIVEDLRSKAYLN